MQDLPDISSSTWIFVVGRVATAGLLLGEEKNKAGLGAWGRVGKDKAWSGRFFSNRYFHLLQRCGRGPALLSCSELKQRSLWTCAA